MSTIGKILKAFLVKLRMAPLIGRLIELFKRLLRFSINKFYVEYTEIPEHIRLRDLFFKELDTAYSKEAVDFVINNCQAALTFTHKNQLLQHALKISNIDGCILEFGVYKGKSINFIASNTKQIVYGFDSFHGLPEQWFGGSRFSAKDSIPKNDTHFTFDLKGELPKCRNNVKLIKGWFEETVPKFMSEVKEKVKFLHIDCDVYSSTYYVLETLRSRIISGTLILFDEFYNYHGWKNHEYKALMDFQNNYNILFEYIGFTDRRMLIRIL